MFVGDKEENLVTWTGCLCESRVRRMARELISKTCKEGQQTQEVDKVASNLY